MTRLIEELASSGLKTASLKHHGHGGKPEVLAKKDSGRHVSAGASASIVEGGGRLLLQAEGSEWPLEKQLQLLSFLEPDVILIEGYKHESFPKALLLRDEGDWHLMQKLQGIKAVFYQDSNLSTSLNRLPFPVFHLDEPKGIDWLLNFVKKEANR